MAEKLTEKEIVRIYEILRRYYERYLKPYGVKLPRLKKDAEYTKNSLVLIYLAQDYPNSKSASKGQLTKFIRSYYPDTNDVQQARHLAMQKGWYIASGTRGNSGVELSSGEYQLITLEKPYPGFIPEGLEVDGWEKLKELYDFRCATCGSKEGESNINYPQTITKLQRAHIDPNRPLERGNIIPQCEKCNRADRNNWVYDKRGRVVKLANSRVITRSDDRVRWEVYKILHKEFKGVNPNE